MIKLYGKAHVQKILSDNAALIDSICASYHLPSAYLKAILLMELPELDGFDLLADALVGFNWFRYAKFHSFILDRHTRNPFRKFDSSTGFGQIFSQVAVEAIRFAESKGIPLFLGISHELSPLNPEDLQHVWKRLNHDRVFNLSCSALNIIHAAYQMTGRVDFGGYSEEEKKMIFTRYNGNARQISAYGEKAYQYYLECSKEERV